MEKLGLIFDLDGVIIDNNYYHQKAWIDYAHKLGIALTEQEFKEKIFGGHNSGILKLLLGKNLTSDESNRMANEKEALYRELYYKDVKPATGLINLLEACKAQQIPCAIATNAPVENLDFIVNALNLKPYFKVLLHAKQVAKGKPAPDIYLEAARQIDRKPQNCIVFEDSATGMQAALNAHCKLVALTTTYTPNEINQTKHKYPDFELINLEFLKKI